MAEIDPVAQADADAVEEIRFAVVMNGGVSLAVWIGGVALEIDRLTRRAGVYDELLRRVGSRARADVITGTSAGGINGAALALAQVNPHADLSVLRQLWASHGRMEALLRTPFVGAPSSLLKGDEYFLPKLEQALGALTVGYEPRSATDRPVDLSITTTLLNGARTVVSDSLGQTLPQDVHAGILHFQHLESEDVDDFGDDAIATTVRRMALAARSSAGFPVAFEPSYIPVDAQPDPTADAADDDPADRVDLGHVASWRDPGSTKSDQSRFAVDGGVLVNTPTVPALERIDLLPAKSAVRRVMLLVYPHAPEDHPVPGDRSGAMPTISDTMVGILGAMRSEAGRTHVEHVETHNREAAERRAGRADVLRSLRKQSATGSLAASIETLHDQLFDYYRDLRIRRAARDLASRTQPVAGWSYERGLRAVEAAQRAIDAGDATPRLPYLPDDSTWRTTEPPAGWMWGVTTAQQIADDALDLIRRVTACLVTTPAVTPAQQDTLSTTAVHQDDVNAAREQVSLARATLSADRTRFDAVWDHPLLRDVPPDQAYWELRLTRYRRAYVAGPDLLPGDVLPLLATKPDDAALAELMKALNDGIPGAAGAEVHQAVDDVVAALVRIAPVVGAVAQLPPDPDERQLLRAWSELLAGADPATLKTRLLELNVVTSCLSNAPDRGVGQPVDLAQISLQTDNRFATVTRLGADKLGGNRLGRFAGFLKESWRINDWTWGRLDAATMLCRAVLDPARLRRTTEPPSADPHGQAQRYADELVAALFGTAPVDDGFPKLVKDVVVELEKYVFNTDTSSLPPSLPRLADLFAWAIQADAATEELPALALAVDADLREGATQGSAGMRFVDENELLLEALKELPMHPADQAAVLQRRRIGLRALRAFDRAGVGREPLDQELDSDLMIRTGVTAAAVGITVLDSPKLGITALRPFTRTARGIALVPYWLARGLTGGSRVGRSLAIVGLALGVAMLGLSLLSGATPQWVGVAGAGAALAAAGYAALRTGSLLHSLVMTSPVIPLLVYAEVVRQGGAADGHEPSDVPRTLLLIGALIVGAVLLGSLPGVVRTPTAVYEDHKTLVWTAVAVVVALVLVGAVVRGEWGWISDRLDDLGWPPAWLDIVLGVVLAGVIAWLVWYVNGQATSLQVRYLRPASGGQPAAWLRIRVTHPAGVACGWALIYAAGFAIIAAATLLVAMPWRLDLRHDGHPVPSTWVLWAIVVTALLFAVALLVAAPLLPIRAKAQLADSLEALAKVGAIRPSGPGDSWTAAVQRHLLAHGLAYAYLFDTQAQSLVLTAAGTELAGRVEAAAPQSPLDQG
ncbi:hypothetical protein GCM10022237_33470 [Nocardioides ginsengisoli]|uniref:Patatin-like protein n=1 Tax=Nocardioides ginsengisoli TaxID=363868 RepID=A0ABW3VX07_9ACTN